MWAGHSYAPDGSQIRTFLLDEFPKFLQAASTAVKEDTLIEIKITTTEGKVIETNLKVKASDIELVKNLTM